MAVRLVRVLVIVLMRMARPAVMLLVHLLVLVNIHVIVPSLVHVVAAVVGMGFVVSGVVREVAVHWFRSLLMAMYAVHACWICHALKHFFLAPEPRLPSLRRGENG